MLSKLILGTVQLGVKYGVNNTSGKPSIEESLEILKRSQQHGIEIIDTAPAYGNAIDVISTFHKTNKPFEIISKFTHANSEDKHFISKTLESLRVSHLYALMFHKFNDVITYPYLLGWLNDLKREGLIKNIGVSIYTNDELRFCIEHADIDVIQLPYNLLDNNSKRGQLLKEAKRCGKIIHTRSVFLQGLFFKDVEEVPAMLTPLKAYLIQLRDIATKYQYSIHELALNYALNTAEIDNVLFGVETIRQLEDNLAAVRSDFNESIFAEVSAINVLNDTLLNPVNWK